MEESQWERLMHRSSTMKEISIDRLKEHRTFVKYKTEDAIEYLGSRNSSKDRRYLISEIDQIRPGFTTTVWKKLLEKGRVTAKEERFAFSILYHNNRHSLDLLAENEAIRHLWVEGLEYLVERYKTHLSTHHHQITDQWISQAFDLADRDHSGHLNRLEVRHLLKNLNLNLKEYQIEEYFNEANIRRDTFDQWRHLDREEFRRFYKYISYRPELLQLVCQYNGNLPKQSKTVKQMALENPLESISHTNTDLIPLKTINRRFPRPMTFLQQSKRPTVKMIEGKNYLTVEQLKEFLHREEDMTMVSIEDAAKLIARFEPSFEGQTYEQIGVDGLRLLLLHDEFCLANPSKINRIYQEMTRPLNEYFIATSHNTYIRDNQVYGSCSPEMYIHVLRSGCRAVEMDCYDGEDGEPIVYHGKTLTKPILFRDIIKAITTEAFRASPYPLFLNLENHCSYDQQGVMASILKMNFQDQLLTKPLKDDFQTLPSPEDLKNKVLVRSRRFPKGKVSADPKSDRSNDETEPNPKAYHPEFARLIIYSQIVSFTNIEHTFSTQQCFHSISFDEGKADDLIDRKRNELVQLTNEHLVRVYPGFTRQDSSNLNPVRYWIHGVQMAALNYQSNDEAMSLQSALFSDNGGCGYVLKPSFLINKAKSFRQEFLHLRIISAQHLPKGEGSKIVDPFVRVSTYGVAEDCSERETPTVRNNGLNPIWNYPIRMRIHCPELCFITFQVRDRDHYTRSDFLGQASVRLNVLQSGYRHVKLRAKNGDFTAATLFLHMKFGEI